MNDVAVKDTETKITLTPNADLLERLREVKENLETVEFVRIPEIELSGAGFKIGDREPISEISGVIIHVRKTNIYYDNEIRKLAVKILKVEEIDDYESLSNTFYNIGKVKEKQAKYEEAIGFLNQSLELDKKANDFQLIANTQKRLGDIYQKLGLFTLAASYFQKQGEVLQKLNK